MDAPADLLERFDPDAVRLAMRLLDPVCRYHRMACRGFDRLPAGPALLVGNHNAGANLIDGLFLIHHYRMHGVRDRIYILGHDALFLTPRLTRLWSRIGVVRASRAQAERVLNAGHKALVFPGGDIDCMRPFKDRKTIRLAGHTGFARIAVGCDVPIVPIVSAGAHESLIILSDGRRIARFLGFDTRFRIHVMPTLFALPWGLLWGPGAGLPYLPLPAKITVEAGAPLLPAWWHGKDDPADAVAHRVQRSMQATLDDLYAERRLPIVG